MLSALNDMPPSRDDTQWQQEPCQCPDGSFRRCLKAGCPTVTPGQSTVKIPFYPGRRHCWCQNSFYSLCMTRRCAVTTSAPPPPPGNSDIKIEQSRRGSNLVNSVDAATDPTSILQFSPSELHRCNPEYWRKSSLSLALAVL